MKAPRRHVRIGDRFGRLVVVARQGASALCRCDCGNEKSVRAHDLGTTKSCGCFRSERIIGMNTTHGETRRERITTEWTTWRSMRQRCEDPKHKSYPDYGGRGITVCERWQDFENFLADMGAKPDGLQLERKDNSKGYSKENCIWATRSAQALNRRPARKRRAPVAAEVAS